jgi:hypothetical protein
VRMQSYAASAMQANCNLFLFKNPAASNTIANTRATGRHS